LAEACWRPASLSVLAIGVYFGLDGKTLVLLLLGGDKSTQVRDIRRARDYWKVYLEGHDGRTK
jgi:hypothetical protein